MEWEPGSDVIADFTWPGFNEEMVITQNVRELFEKYFSAIDYAPIEYWQAPRLKRPTRVTKRTKSRVWLPYKGPTQWDVIPTTWCHLDLPRSNISIENVCPVCLRPCYKWPPINQRVWWVDPATWHGEHVFRIRESLKLFCTERAKELILQAGFTNVNFDEAGIIPE